MFQKSSRKRTPSTCQFFAFVIFEKKMTITQARLKELFDYDPNTGSLVWKTARQGIKVGEVAGSINKVSGYRAIMVDGRAHRAHRLVWLWHHGKFPDHEIDHVDRDKQNNRIENLRDVSSMLNKLNRRSYAASGFKGVRMQRGRFFAQIAIFGKTVCLGIFDSPEEAHEVFKQVHRDLYWQHSECWQGSATNE